MLTTALAATALLGACPGEETPATCGNGALDVGEECDGALGSNPTCADRGYEGDQVVPCSGCFYDDSACAGDDTESSSDTEGGGDSCLSVCPALPIGLSLASTEDLGAFFERVLPEACSNEAFACQWLAGVLDEAISHSSEEVDEPSADEPQTVFDAVLLRFGTPEALAFLEERELALPGPTPASLEEAYPCGDGPNGLTLCGAEPWPGTEAFVLAGLMKGTIPAADAELSYQFGFVFDADGNAANNYVPQAPFTNDFFLGTDRWYAATYAPGVGWTLDVSTANGSDIVPATSAARVIIDGATIIAVIPIGEFSDPCPAYRMTAFGHRGDFGLQPPHYWSGDTEPTVDAPLQDNACE